MVTIPGSGETFDLDRPGAVAAWNRALNRRYAMENLQQHRSRIVRWIETRRRRRVVSMVSGFDRALDLGAEDGSLAHAWRDRGRFTMLLDLDAAMLGKARGARATADACRIPVANGSFDVVVLSAIPGVCVRLQRQLEPTGHRIGRATVGHLLSIDQPLFFHQRWWRGDRQ